MRAMSLLRAWIYGAGVFAAVTASLTVAMTVAITGPPTESEMDDLQAFMANAGARLGVMAERAGAEACVQLPPDITGPLCPQAAVTAQETAPSDDEAIVIEAYRTAPEPSGVPTVAPVTETIAARGDDTYLLGDAASAPRPSAVRAERPVAPRAQPERRVQPRRAAQQRRTSPARAERVVRPVAVARATIAPLESPAARALEDLAAATATEIAAEEDLRFEDEQAFEDVWPEESRPTESRGLAVERVADAYPAPWDAQYQDPVYDDEYDRDYEDEAYEEERERRYAEREARRRYRARTRAYREWRRDW